MEWISKYFLIYSLLFLVVFSSTAQNNDVQLANEYYKNSEFAKAKTIFERLSRDKKNLPLIHKNYLATLFALDDAEMAEKYLKKVTKENPENLIYRIDFGFFLKKQNKDQDADKYFSRLISEIARDENKVRMASQYMNELRLFDYSEKAYLESRKQLNNKSLYSYELANIYIFTQNLDLVVEELINIASSSPSSVEMIKYSLQGLIKKEEDYQRLEKIFLANIQNNPQELYYAELLSWLYVQQKQFYKAFIQTRAIDKRIKGEGEKLLELGMIAFLNKSYDDATTIFEYITVNYPTSVNYVIAKNYLISSKEELIKNTFPVDKAKIQSLINDYSSLVKEAGINANTAEAIRNQALLYAFYYNKLDTAQELIERAINIPGQNPASIAKYKLDLGDVYLLKGEPWEATLLYSQVEKSQKEKPIGYEAKLKNAKLSYYKGDFTLAQAHLDILKLATSREIANDAMELSLLIQDNIGMDSTEEAMKEYAKVDLLLFKNQKEEALTQLEELKQKFKDHTIIDLVLFQEGKIHMTVGNFEKAVENFKRIGSDFSDEIYGDDALFQIGKIYEENLNQPSLALETYTNHLKTYPGSIFTAEVRKRLRKLRGDQVN